MYSWYIWFTAAFFSFVSDGNFTASRLLFRCSSFDAPGITQLTSGKSNIHRRAMGARFFLSGNTFLSSSTACNPTSKGTPLKVSPLSKAAPSLLKFLWSSSSKVESEENFPVSSPLAKGTGPFFASASIDQTGKE